MAQELVVTCLMILPLGPDPPHHIDRVHQSSDHGLELISSKTSVSGGVDIVKAEEYVTSSEGILAVKAPP